MARETTTNRCMAHSTRPVDLGLRPAHGPRPAHGYSPAPPPSAHSRGWQPGRCQTPSVETLPRFLTWFIPFYSAAPNRGKHSRKNSIVPLCLRIVEAESPDKTDLED